LKSFFIFSVKLCKLTKINQSSNFKESDFLQISLPLSGTKHAHKTPGASLSTPQSEWIGQSPGMIFIESETYGFLNVSKSRVTRGNSI
jgi:hypothetical protein